MADTRWADPHPTDPHPADPYPADPLTAAVDSLLATAGAAARTPEVAATVAGIGRRLHGPLRVAIAGKVKAGKSTLLNALLDEGLAATDAGECTKIATWYVQADTPRVTIHPRTGAASPATFHRAAGELDIDLGDHRPADVERLEIGWPTPRLQTVTFIDTPGIASISADVSARTQRLLTPDDDRAPEVDAILYLLRHAHASDARFLESFHDDDLAQGSPANVVGVLSRADEIGACRLDALDTASRIARRYQADSRLRRLCPIVLPVAGLLGFAGTTLREREFQTLRRVAALPVAERGALLLTADRFTRRESTDVTELERTHLVTRLGLFGVRLSVELIATGRTSDATALSVALTEFSGLERLRTVIGRQFTERSRVLKARSALALLAAVLSADGCTGQPSLRAAIEQIEAGTHAFEEIRLLTRLRSDELGLSDDRREELDRVLGGSGHDPASRLGLPETATSAQVRVAAAEAFERWRRVGEHPLSARGAQLAARGACRTLEGITASLVSRDVRP